LEEGNSNLVGHIKSGYYAKVFASSRCWSLLLNGLPPFDSKLEGNMQNAAKYFYNALKWIAVKTGTSKVKIDTFKLEKLE
jgi:hypothetical protein